MKKSKRLHYFEATVYLVVAVITFLVPVLMHFDNGKSWEFIVREWKRLLPFLVIFLINNFFLAPKLLLKRKYLAYFISCLALISSVILINSVVLEPNFRKFEPEEIHKQHPPRHFQTYRNLEKQHHSTNEKPLYHPPPKKHPWFNFGLFIIGLFIIGFNSGIKIFVQWTSEQDKRDEKERQYLTTELAYLKHQISPHFFMNTLNNIHALIDIDTERAKDTIIKLSYLMRYLLYESDADKVSLNKEIEFMESYIELMRLRYDETNLTISISYTAHPENIHIPSLLFLPLIENAFKHGVDSRSESFINIGFVVNDDFLTFEIQNSIAPTHQLKFDENSGIGLENIRKRLELIYKDKYNLSIKTSENIFEISLKIPVII